MKTIKTWRDPYGEGFSTCRPVKINIDSGLTILVGCNGAGKTTMLRNIKEQLKKDNIPMIYFDNLHNGGSDSISKMFYNNNLAMASAMWTASEGENIILNVSMIASELRDFIQTGETNESKKEKEWIKLFKEDDPEEIPVPNERWILLDAIDSGLSIDNIIETKALFKLIIDDAKKQNIDMYIIAVANEYELANGEKCFDVNTGKYITFSDYNDYRKFIIKSRDKKEKRLARLENKRKE